MEILIITRRIVSKKVGADFGKFDLIWTIPQLNLNIYK